LTAQGEWLWLWREREERQAEAKSAWLARPRSSLFSVDMTPSKQTAKTNHTTHINGLVGFLWLLLNYCVNTNASKIG